MSGSGKKNKEPCNLDNVTLQDIQLCVINAERLYKDSKSVSFPTKVSLFELSFEEVSKSWAIYFKYLENKFGFFKGEINLNDVSGGTNELVGTWSEIRSFLNDPELCSNLTNHNKKIGFLIELRKFIIASLKLLSNPSFIKMLIKDVIPIDKININFDEAHRVMEIFEHSMTEEKLKELAKAKNTGLYADFTISGHIKSPDILKIDLEPIEPFLLTFIHSLKSILYDFIDLFDLIEVTILGRQNQIQSDQMQSP